MHVTTLISIFISTELNWSQCVYMVKEVLLKKKRHPQVYGKSDRYNRTKLINERDIEIDGERFCAS